MIYDICKLINLNRFPHSQPELLKQWVRNMHREGFAPSKKSVVCSDHFQPSCFDRTGRQSDFAPDLCQPSLLCLITFSRFIPQWFFCNVFASTKGPDAAYTQFANLYKSVYDTAFPIISSDASRRSIGPKQPWMTSALFKSCRKKNKLYKTYLKNPTLQNKSNFNNYRNKFKTLKTETIRIYYAERFALCASDLKKTWSIIKELLNSKGDTGFPHTFLIDGTETKDALIIAESFNSYFTNLGPKLAEKFLILLNRMMLSCLTLHFVHLGYCQPLPRK